MGDGGPQLPSLGLVSLEIHDGFSIFRLVERLRESAPCLLQVMHPSPCCRPFRLRRGRHPWPLSMTNAEHCDTSDIHLVQSHGRVPLLSRNVLAARLLTSLVRFSLPSQLLRPRLLSQA